MQFMVFNSPPQLPDYVNTFMRVYDIQPGQTIRGDCPVCGGFNRFQVKHDAHAILWNCFGSSCRAKGAANLQIHPKRIHSARIRMDSMFTPGTPVPVYGHTEWDTEYQEFLNHFSQVERFDPRWEWLEKHNCTDAFDVRPEKFMYDKIKDRLVFIEFDENYATYSRDITLVTGRSLNGAEPKWFKYEVKRSFFSSMSMDPQIPYTDVFLCEDAPSACSLGRFGLGVALCGTACDTDGLHKYLEARIGLKRIQRLFVCLDEDAVRKGHDLRRNLDRYRGLPIGQLMLSDDAKNLSYKQLRKQIPKYVHQFNYIDIMRKGRFDNGY